MIICLVVHPCALSWSYLPTSEGPRKFPETPGSSDPLPIALEGEGLAGPRGRTLKCPRSPGTSSVSAPVDLEASEASTQTECRLDLSPLELSLFMVPSSRGSSERLCTALIPVSGICERCLGRGYPWQSLLSSMSLCQFCGLEKQTQNKRGSEKSQDTTEMHVKTLQGGVEDMDRHSVYFLPGKLRTFCEMD